MQKNNFFQDYEHLKGKSNTTDKNKKHDTIR